MPFLVGTAYLHSVIIQEKRGMLKVWNLALIGMTYSLCIFGTFLTRSGVVQSVHSFANAGWFGTLFLVYVGVIAAVFAGFLIHRLPELKSASKLESVVSREGSFLLNNYVFMGLTAIVLWGTMAPVWVAYFSKGEQIMRGPTWFQTYAGPLAIALLILTGVGPLIAWRRATWTNLRKSFRIPLLAAAAAAPAAWLLGYQSFYAIVFLTLCAFVIGTIALEYGRGMRVRMRRGESALRSFLELLARNQRRYGGYVVHLSVVLMFVGFAGSVFDLEQTKLMKPGEKWSLAGYTVENRGARPVVHPHYAGALVRLALYKDDKPVGILTPEKRIYFQQEQPATFPAVSSTLGEDFYVILNGLEVDQTAALKVYVNPLVNWIWIGGVIFVIGNTLLLWRIPPAGVSSADD
jgi:cytochrome c-type biogenesis protein CcmF